MLSSRYVHLHEALGLGAMWLKQGARVLVNDEPREQETIVAPTINIQAVPEIVSNSVLRQARSKPQEKMTAARLSALQRVGSKTLQQHDEMREAVPLSPQKVVLSKQDWLAQLSGSIKPVRVMVLSVCASPADVAAGQLFSGEEGVLLRKMLAAINLSADDVLLNTWLKDLPDFNPKPAPEVVADALPRVQAEYELSGEPVLLLLGDFFQRPEMQAYLAQLGDKVRHFSIAHPARLINHPQLKRPAWEALQALQAVL